MLKNKRYVVTNNTQNQPKIWSIDQCKHMRTYNAKTFEQVKKMLDDKYDLKPEQTPYPYSWFSVDLRLGCLTVHLDEDNWHKCVASDLATNVQLMMSQHHMDHGQAINFDIEEKQMNFGLNLVEQELLRYNDPLNFCKLESLQALLH